MAKYMSEEELEKMRKSMSGTGLYLNIKSGESLTFNVSQSRSPPLLIAIHHTSPHGP